MKIEIKNTGGSPTELDRMLEQIRLEVVMHFHNRCMRCSKAIPVTEEFCRDCKAWLEAREK